jgi:hypothetical protein
MADSSSGRDGLRRTLLLATLGIVIVVYLVLYLRSSGITSAFDRVEDLDYTARNLPLLAMHDADVDSDGAAGSEGNPFAFRAPPTPTPNLTPPPTPVPRPTLPPRPTPTPRIALGLDGEPKPPPPPFDREYIGYLGPRPIPVAAFRKGGAESTEIEVAAVGEVLDEIFIVRAVGLESVTIGFVGYDVSEDTSVPLSDK